LRDRRSPGMTLGRSPVLAILLGMALTGCAQTNPGRSDAAAGTDEPSARFIGVIGTRAQHSPPFLARAGPNFYCLRSFIDRRTGEVEHQLYVSDSYSGAPRRWNAARDGAGLPLRFIEIGRNEITCDGGCSYLEEFAASIPESELRANPKG